MIINLFESDLHKACRAYSDTPSSAQMHDVPFDTDPPVPPP